MGNQPLTLSMHCTCGDSLVAKVREVALADEMIRVFARTHAGPGHAPCYPERQPRRMDLRNENHQARTA